VTEVPDLRTSPISQGRRHSGLGGEVGLGTKIWHFCHVQKGAKIGKGCILGQNVNIANDVVLGNNVRSRTTSRCTPARSSRMTSLPRPVLRPYERHEPTLAGEQAFALRADRDSARRDDRRERHDRLRTHGRRYAFIAAGAVVTKDVPDYALMQGVPRSKPAG